MSGWEEGFDYVIGNNGRKSRQSIIISKSLGLMNIKLGSMLIQEKAIGGYPKALSYQEHCLINILKSKVL